MGQPEVTLVETSVTQTRFAGMASPKEACALWEPSPAAGSPRAFSRGQLTRIRFISIEGNLTVGGSTFHRLVPVLVAVAAIGVVLAILAPGFEYEELGRVILSTVFAFHGWRYLAIVAQLPLGLGIDALLIVTKMRYVIIMRRVLSVLFSVVSVYAAFEMAKRTLNESDAVCAAALVAFNPLFVMYSFTGSAESLTLMLFLLFCYLFASERYLHSSLVLLLGVFTHYSIWAVIPSILFAVALRRERREALIPLAIGVSGIAAWCAINYSVTGNPLFFVENLHTTTAWIYARFNVFNLGGMEFVLPLLIYPLTFTGPFFIRALANLRREQKALNLFVVFNVLLLTAGAITKSTMPWARYYLVSVPLVVASGFSRDRRLIVLYFILATISACIQLVWASSFYDLLTAPRG